MPLYREARETFRRRYVEGVLEQTKGNVSQGAKVAGMNLRNFRELVRRAGVRVDHYRGPEALAQKRRNVRNLMR